MKWVTPKVYMVAETAPTADAHGSPGRRYLKDIGAPAWNTNSDSDGEYLVELGGRMCYRSFDAKLNANLTRVREGNAQYIANLVKVGHGSVLEHVSATFIFTGVSRVFTHELVRHRVGVAISQESLRYVALDDIPMTQVALGDSSTEVRRVTLQRSSKVEREEWERAFTTKISELEALLTGFRSTFVREDDPMSYKKAVTSWMRRWVPIGIATSIMWTANLRTLRHVLALRTAPGAEQEIRQVFDHVGEICARRFPAVFADFERLEDGTWLPTYSKV